MKLKKLFIFLVLFFVCFPVSNVLAEDLKIEEGKNLKFVFKGDGNSYDDSKVYDNVNIGAGTKVVLDSKWEYVFLSSGTRTTYENREVTVPGSTTTIVVQDQKNITDYNYERRENLATISVAENGNLILNSGSELSIRNQYSLITSTQDISLRYKEDLDDEHNTIAVVDFDNVSASNIDTLYNYNDYENRQLNTESVNIFKGDIIFESGDVNTVLTFQQICDKEAKEYGKLPEAIGDRKTGTTPSGGDILDSDNIVDTTIQTTPEEKYNSVTMVNNFVINSNRAIFNVEGGASSTEEFTGDDGGVTLIGDTGTSSTITGDGCFVKRGKGTLILGYDTITRSLVDATGLTGANTDGYGWSIEEGRLVASIQKNLGSSSIYISDGQLALDATHLGLTNNIKFSGDQGSICLASNSTIDLKGDISADIDTGGVATFQLYHDSNLTLSGENDAEHFVIMYGGEEGGQNNTLKTNVAGLATKSIFAMNTTEDEKEKEFASLELIIDESDDKEYSGSLQGEMYLRKTGTGIVTLSGENTYTQGTYITEGGLLLANSDAIGTGKIWFDGGERGSSTTYSTMGVSSITVGDIKVENNIHVKNGAILDVYENQNMTIFGDIVSYDARPGYETEFIKNGLGEVKISGTLDADRQVTITSFTVTEGGFVIDNKIVLDSYFSLNGNKAYLEMHEDAGVKNNIDVFNGDLIIFNEHNISSSAAINFHSVAESTDSFSKLHTTSITVLTNDTVATQINIKKNIEFVTEATTTANFNKFNFESGSDVVIVKSGKGNFIADNNGSNFEANSLYLNEGMLRLENTNITVSNKTFVDGGILSISSTSHFASTATSPEDKKITVLNGGIGIYDDNSIDGDTKLSFEGTDSENLSKLIVEAANVNLTNDIYVKTGVIIENEKDLTFSGESITYDPSSPGILAKSGAGTMTIDSAETFEMGEVRALKGNLLVKSDIDVSTITISGEKTILSFADVDNANIANTLSINNNSLLSLANSNVNASDMNITNSTMTLANSNINAADINVLNSTMTLTDINSRINATNINVCGQSLIYGIGTYNSTINMKAGSVMCIGEDRSENDLSAYYSAAYSKEKANRASNGTSEIEKINVKNIVFEEGSTLKIDIKSEGGETNSDKLIVAGDITVQKDVELDVNLMGSLSEYKTTKSFEFITYSGNGTFTNSTNEIFNIILNNPRLSANTLLDGKSIFLQIVQQFSYYELPGLTTNQKSVTDLLNKISTDEIAIEKLKGTLETLDGFYGIYQETGDRTKFINALQDLSGIFYANSFMTCAMLSKANIIYNRLNDYSKERELDNRLWAQVYTNNFTVAENEENPKFENNIYGMIAGYDTVSEDNFVFGIAGFYGQGQLKQLNDKADIADAGANIYGDYKIQENIDIKGLLWYSSQNFDTTRELRFNKQELKSKYATNTISFDLEAGYRYDFHEKLSLRPIIGANCTVVSNGDIKEDGAEQKLKIEKNSYTKADVRVGVGLQSRTISPFNWYVSAVVKRIIIGDKFTTKACFVNIPEYNFEIESTQIAATSFGGNIGCSYDISPNFNVSLDLNADTGTASMLGGNIGASYRW